MAEREQLNAAIDYLREGDVLVSTKLDRLARSMRNLLEIVDSVKAKGAASVSSACTSTLTLPLAR